MPDAATIHLSDVRYAWPGRASFVLDIPEFKLKAGSSTLLLGASGSGKSTLLSLICGTIVADHGRIEVCGHDLRAMRASARDRFRAEHIGVVFQQFNLLPFGTVLDNIVLPLSFAPARRKRSGDVHHSAARLCRDLNLSDDLLSVPAGRLSVGQQQRVAVARALIGAPPLLIADEPTSALDEGAQTAFLDLLFAGAAAQGTSILMVSHNARLGARFERTLQLEDIQAGVHA